jgi:hypothetical protein
MRSRRSTTRSMRLTTRIRSTRSTKVNDQINEVREINNQINENNQINRSTKVINKVIKKIDEV